MNEANVKRVWQQPPDSTGTPYHPRGYKNSSNAPIGWFTTKHNSAAGWTVFPLDTDDIAWFKQQKEPMKNVFRVATDQSTSIIKFNFATGTYAFLDNEYLLDTDKIKFQKFSPYTKFILTKDNRANKETGLNYNDIPSARYLY